MDASPKKPGFSVAVPPPPFSPWLRLAHLWTVPDGAPLSDGVSLRQLRDWQLFFQLKGRTWFALPDAGGHVPLPAGSIALIPPGLIHGWAHLGGSHLAVHFDLHAEPSLEPMAMLVPLARRCAQGPLLTDWTWTLHMAGASQQLPLVWHLSDGEDWEHRLRPLVALYGERRHGSPRARLGAAGILAAAIADLLERADGSPVDPMLAILARAARRPVQQVSISALASEAGLGETAFRAAVRRFTGLSPRAYLEHLRLERAAYALRLGEDSIAAVASAAGYEDPFHFSRVFRRVYGAAPSQWQKVQQRD